MLKGFTGGCFDILNEVMPFLKTCEEGSQFASLPTKIWSDRLMPQHLLAILIRAVPNSYGKEPIVLYCIVLYWVLP